LFVIVVALAVGISFLFTGDFTSKAYSDRLFIIGIIITSIGVFVFVTVAGTRKGMGIPSIIKTEEDARKLMEKTQELRDKAEKRYDAGSQVWAIGIACMILSVLSYFLLSIFQV
jgi:sugar phosphate permease